MGIIDDYYGGYENIAAWTNEDGETDFDGAYEAASGLGPEFPEPEEDTGVDEDVDVPEQEVDGGEQDE